MKQNSSQLFSQLFETTCKQFILGILYLIVFSYLLGLLLYSPLLFPFNYISLIGGLINVVSIIVVHIVPMVYIRRFFVFYILHLIISLFPLTVFCLLAGIVGPLFWYVMTPVSVYVLFPNKKTVLISAFCLFLMLSAFALTFILPDKFVTFKYLSHFMILIPSMIDALYIFLLICYCLYFIHRFHRLQIERILDVIESDKKKTDFILLPPEKAEESKYEKIYERITAYFEAEKPYLNANFKIGKMAADLNINTAYLAKAIGMKRSMNFNNFVNFYRIEKAKELIRNKVAKYTLEYIYLSSGFNSQSSFNSAFKLQESITPSEYAKQFA